MLKYVLKVPVVSVACRCLNYAQYLPLLEIGPSDKAGSYVFLPFIAFSDLWKDEILLVLSIRQTTAGNISKLQWYVGHPPRHCRAVETTLRLIEVENVRLHQSLLAPVMGP